MEGLIINNSFILIDLAHNTSFTSNYINIITANSKETLMTNIMSIIITYLTITNLIIDSKIDLSLFFPFCDL